MRKPFRLDYSEVVETDTAVHKRGTHRWERTSQPSKPVRPRYIITDATYEKLGEIIAENPHGVLAMRDEMRGLFLKLANEEFAEARAFYLQAWSGGAYTFDRIGRGTIRIDNLRLSIIGSIQPGPLSELMARARRGLADDGMMERFLVAWPDPPSEWRQVDRRPNQPAKRTVDEVFDRLDTLTAQALGAQTEIDGRGEAKSTAFLRLDGEAQEIFSVWLAELQARLGAAEAEGFEAALSKFKHHVPALALALHIIDGGVGPVIAPAMSRALSWAKYFESHLRRLHGSGRQAVVRAARTIIDKARSGALPSAFTARHIYRNDWSGLTEQTIVAAALDMLAVRSWLVEDVRETGGRPTSV